MFTGQLNEGMNALFQPQKKERKKEGILKKNRSKESSSSQGLLCSANERVV